MSNKQKDDYRPDAIPTGQEVKNIVKYFSMLELDGIDATIKRIDKLANYLAILGIALVGLNVLTLMVLLIK